jgi:hypothetical protein
MQKKASGRKVKAAMNVESGGFAKYYDKVRSEPAAKSPFGSIDAMLKKRR